MLNRAQKSVSLLFVAACVAFGGAGCNDTAKTPVQARPVQIALPPQPQVAPPPPVAAEHKVVAPPAVQAPTSAEALAASSQAAFDAGEQDFKAGHLGKAREEFDQALDQLLASGYDLDTDPRLGNLYHHIIDTVSLDELEAFRAGDGFSE
ncbi:MAG TPA: hypothetical protein VH161_02950, partial [Candidatus Acidoferrales bacterium]|nr:hypothetical protein [Candidatus Acidoferrales bacterium]